MVLDQEFHLVDVYSSVVAFVVLIVILESDSSSGLIQRARINDTATIRGS